MMTGLLRALALKNKVLDVPNHRSSHEIPTPRGGGLAFVISFLVALVFSFWHQDISSAWFPFFFLSLTLIAVIGVWDDYTNLSAKWRLLGHFVAAGMVIYGMGGISAFIPLESVLLRVLATGLLVIYLVWFINSFNFMDGIDGIAAIQALTVSFGGAILFLLDGQAQWVGLQGILIVSVTGFLLWNFPKAQIFMGDAGSGFLGLLLGIFSLLAAKISISLFYGWIILNAVFFSDATITLLRRLWFRQNIFMPHCSHAYQQAARDYASHPLITIVVALINCVWLLPIALLVEKGIIPGMLGILIAYVSLSLIVLKFNPGR